MPHIHQNGNGGYVRRIEGQDKVDSKNVPYDAVGRFLTINHESATVNLYKHDRPFRFRASKSLRRVRTVVQRPGSEGE